MLITTNKGILEVEDIRPEHIRKFERTIRALRKLQKDIRAYSPYAEFFVTNFAVDLMIGPVYLDSDTRTLNTTIQCWARQ